VTSAFLRGVACVVMALLGGALFLFSVAVAFGWDRGPFSVIGIVIAISGLSLMFGAYWLVRTLSGAPLAAVCLKVALGLGSTFLLVGVIALFLRRQDLGTPTGYFLAVGCLCVVAFQRFHSYTRKH
jgi:hypothetical protein